MEENNKEIYTSNPVSTEYNYYLEEIRETRDHIVLLSILEEAGENDVVYIHINSPGGSLHTTTQIIGAIDACRGNVIALAEGEVKSGGSLIFFACDGFKVSPFCEFLLHDGSKGEMGKLNEHLAAAASSSSLLKRLYKVVYGPFFTEEEIQSVLDGKDLYLNATEVEDKLLACQKKREEQEQEKDEDEL